VVSWRSTRLLRQMFEGYMKGRFLRRFLLDDSGQDLIEYGLLASIIGIAGALIFPSIKTAMNLRFGEWGTNVNNLWTPNNP
jgi:Flp pilus assembly pilin Flp